MNLIAPYTSINSSFNAVYFGDKEIPALFKPLNTDFKCKKSWTPF